MGTLRARTAVLALGEFTNTGLTALMAVMLTRLLTKDDFGTYRQVLLAYSMLVVFLGSQIGESLLYFLPRAKYEDKRVWLSQTILLSAGAGIAVGVALYVGASLWASWSGNPALADLVRVFALYPLADRLARLVPTALIAEDRAGSAAAFTVLLGLVRVSSAAIPAAMGCSLQGILWTTNLAWFALAAAGLVWLHVRAGIGWAAPRRTTAREQIGYVAPLLAGSAVGAFHEQFGQFLAAVTLSTAAYAEYAVGAVQLPLVGIWIASISAALMPDLVRRAAEHDTRGLLDLWHRGMRKGALVVFPVVALALAIAPDLMRALYGASYSRAAVPFVLFLVALVPRITNYGIVFRALGKTGPVVIWTGAGLLVNLVLSTGLSAAGKGTSLQFLAPAIGYVVGYYATVAVVLALMSRLVRAPIRELIPIRRLLPLAALSAGCAAIAAATRWIPVERWIGAGPTPVAIARCSIAAAVFAVTFVGIGWKSRVFEPGEQRLILSLLRIRTAASTREPVR